MKPNIGVNLRVTGHCNQGSRKYMEDTFSVAYQQTKDGTDLEYAYFGIFDGHGGKEAAQHAKENLMDNIVSHPEFWSENDEDVTKAIREGFIHTHQMMFKEHYSWPKTATGLPSTSGTTASIAFVRNSKIYVGHVGDSGIVLGYQDPDKKRWRGRPLTRDHKPECAVETRRIQECGGKVIYKAGVPRVVWNRPRIGHKGPVRRSTQIDEIPFLAVARALGDFWSYNSELDQFVVSPDPDVHVYPIDITKDRCLVLGTDGLWNMLSPEDAVTIVWYAETMNEAQTKTQPTEKLNDWINPSKNLVDFALDKWLDNGFRADNCSVVTVLLDPPGPPKQPSTATAASVQSADNSPITSLTGLPSIDVLDGPLTSLEAIANRFISEEARKEERTPSARGPMPTKSLPPQGSTCRVNSAKEKTVPLKSEVLKCRGDVKFGFMKKRRKHSDNEAGGSSKKVAPLVDSENDPKNVGRFSKETRPGAEFGPKENKRRRTASSPLDETSGARPVVRRSCEARELRSSFKRTLRQRNVDTFESLRLNRTRSHTWSQGGRNK